ncbi:MAG TPA: pantetheine-phosphate adenylyltransferase [Gammaproteobacteria bacterium]|nr:pantetheine-phosphate adenylyltransferase [Gammaproteobacteria bacterium]
MEKTVIYPGTFDPLTYGHVQLVERALRLFDTVVIAIAASAAKTPLLSLPERQSIAETVFAEYAGVQVVTFSGLIVDFMREQNIRVIVRGIRTVGDMEYEFRLATMNQCMYPEMETIFLKPEAGFAHISSTVIREIARMGGDLSAFVPEAVLTALKNH